MQAEQQYSLLDRLERAPRPFDAERARHGLAEWRARAKALGRADLVAVADSPAARPLFDALFGNSPFLGRCLLREPAFAGALIAEGPDLAVARELAALVAETGGSRAEIARRLRLARSRLALAIAVADILELWPLERVTAALSDFAETALRVAVGHLLAAEIASGALAVPDPARPEQGSGYVVLGMGKLGARELNYSSDIDLIVLYDREIARCPGRLPAGDLFVRLTRNLVKLLQERTGDGHVFRVDLRLRPDPGAMPVAVPVDGAEIYYESAGRSWERAAMIKARPLAGDLAVGRAFLDTIRPFVWRKHLDFAAIEDIHAMTRLIRSHHGQDAVALRGHDVKLGRGGIREIEFFVQIHQLIAGGRNPRLRVPATLAMLERLVEVGRLDPAGAQTLHEAYVFLRRVEHRLQMIEDQQTHRLPTTAEGLRHVAVFLGFEDAESFEASLRRHLDCVQRHYNTLIEAADTARQSGAPALDVAGDPDLVAAALAARGFQYPDRAREMLELWQSGRYRATRSARARERFDMLLPVILDAVARTTEPDATLARFDDFLARLPAGVQIFSLFAANPRLIDLMAEIFGIAPGLAETLTRHPSLLEAVLEGDFFAPLPPPEALAADLDVALATARDFQDVLDILRRWTNERRFQVGVQLLRGMTDVTEAGRALSRIAEAALRALLPCVEEDFARLHGRLPGAAWAVLAMGRLGAGEMTLTSDLDLVFVYDVAGPEAVSDGEKPLSADVYYSRLTKRVINAITAPTGEGRLYEVDMRLRPSGNQGPIAVSYAGFVKYHEEGAWIWERMALTRARPIAGEGALCERLAATIRDLIARPVADDTLAAAVVEMRARIAEQHPPEDPWNVKHARGGLIDAEFIAQYLVLREASQWPELVSGHTRTVFAQARRAGLLDDMTGQRLIAAYDLLDGLHHRLRLAGIRRLDEARASLALRSWLARSVDAADFDALKARLLAAQAEIAAAFTDIVGRAAPPAPPPDPLSETAQGEA